MCNNKPFTEILDLSFVSYMSNMNHVAEYGSDNILCCHFDDRMNIFVVFYDCTSNIKGLFVKLKIVSSRNGLKHSNPSRIYFLSSNNIFT